MKGTPTFFIPNKKTNANQFYRNYWCDGYEFCLTTAAQDDLYLDCTKCLFRDHVMEEYSIFITRKK
jgi:hypothetical protein